MHTYTQPQTLQLHLFLLCVLYSAHTLLTLTDLNTQMHFLHAINMDPKLIIPESFLTLILTLNQSHKNPLKTNQNFQILFRII